MKRHWLVFCVVFLLGVATGLVVAWYIVQTLPALPLLLSAANFGTA